MNIKMSRVGLALLSGVALAPQWARADDTIKVGLLATLEGPFTVLGQDGVRGAELAFKEANYTAGGKKIEVIKGSSDASRRIKASRRRKLVEQDGVKVLVGLLQDEGFAVKDYVKTQLNVTFSMARRPPKTRRSAIRRPIPSASPPTARNGWPRRVRFTRTKATDRGDSRRGLFLPHTQAFGFMADLQGRRTCAEEVLGADRQRTFFRYRGRPGQGRRYLRRARRRGWRNFLTQYQQAGGTAPLIGGLITVDQTVLGTQGKRRTK
jgi:branched-chain amino acid transport system substrate-binding protein